MRRVVGLVLILIGAFAIVVGPLLRFWAYDQLAVVPLNQDSESVSRSDDMTVLYVGDVAKGAGPEAVKTGVSVVATRVVRGNPEATEAVPDGDVMVWDVGSVIEDDGGAVITASLDHLCLDRRTNRAVQPCEGEGIEDNSDDERIDADDAVTHTGLSYKFPFDTQQQEYEYFDNIAKASFPARYEATETIEGVETYKFVQVVPLTKLAAPDIDLPGKVAGEPGTPAIKVSRWYENTRTVWVEPYSGIIVKGQEQISQTLRARDGREVVTAFAGTIGFDDETIRESAKNASDTRSQLRLVRDVGPLTLVIGGVLFVVVGVVLAVGGTRGRRERPTAGDQAA